jgi:hypothetical protein
MREKKINSRQLESESGIENCLENLKFKNAKKKTKNSMIKEIFLKCGSSSHP